MSAEVGGVCRQVAYLVWVYARLGHSFRVAGFRTSRAFAFVSGFSELVLYGSGFSISGRGS